LRQPYIAKSQACSAGVPSNIFVVGASQWPRFRKGSTTFSGLLARLPIDPA